MKTDPNDLVSAVQETSYHYDKNGERETMHSVDGGLTKREYFAAMAMQGHVASPNIDTTILIIVNNAVALADALIAELNK